ncbi:iron-siderophore ABC transporter substrate-binding protein [filamentous cyanobacterium CCP1]|nr:iron-siderophore ABC transporter substrate-binding protein [filamentous cyanobacterium CCP2]PSB66876.1 iron-siderophore ABC transporter substrate-binding protein [filamentous cyanobacterium CCP1]
MLDRIYRYFYFFLLTLLAIVFVSACNRIIPNSVQNPGSNGVGECTVVQHGGGETCAPLQPSRVVALDSISLEYLVALGIQPIGAVLSDQYAKPIQQDLEGITDIGSTGEPSLEKVLSLQPDLIVGGDYYQTIYTQSSQIAPTILFGFEHSGQWKETFMSLAEMLQKTAIAEQVMEDYNARLEEFQQQMGNRLQQIDVSVIRIYPDQINLYLKDSFCGTILQDAGLSRPEAQNLSAAEAQQRFGNPIQVSISKETLNQADGTVMFVWTGENTVEANQQAQQKLAEFKADPLWRRLNVVQNNQVYQVPSYWIGSGPIAANAVIDDLFKYLVGTPD